jgi:myo-inositol 2-dehydrogenase/D-chiro-inositol 1-dehydrogenase
VIGTGMIGRDHIRRLSGVLAGAQVVAVTDVDRARASETAAPIGARVHETGADVVHDSDVDAVVVTSWGPTHAEYVLASIAAGKNVFCEKPLAESSEACLRILDAETAAGRRLVQVGYMRRYDAAYRALKQVVDSGCIGAPLLMHCAHRNPSQPDHFTPSMSITDSGVHDIDTARWMFGQEIVATRVLTPRPTVDGTERNDPLLIILEMDSGAIVDAEIAANIRYGYDIRSEVVGEAGTAALGELSPVVVRREGGFTSPVPVDWRERFVRAYDVELQEWLDGVSAGRAPTGPSSWDGYAAAAVSESALEALHTGDRTLVKLADRPELYA